jgi:hypothetical protein
MFTNANNVTMNVTGLLRKAWMCSNVSCILLLLMNISCADSVKSDMATTYTADQLINIGCKLGSSLWLNSSAWERIKHLGICRPLRGTRAGRNKQRPIHVQYGYRHVSNSEVQCGVHKDNLISVVGQQIESIVSNRGSVVNSSDSFTNRALQKNLIQVPVYKQTSNFALINCQSVRNKTSCLTDHLIDNDIDLCVLTETWLKPGDSDQRIISDMTPPGYKLHHVPRNGRGGGIAVLLRSSFSVTPQDSFNAVSFESMRLAIKIKSVTIHLVVIYRVPPSKKNGLHSNQFHQEFCDMVDHLSTLKGNILIAGDFNIHWDKTESREMIELAEFIESHNLQQHIQDPTHIKGHTIDLIITRSDESLIKSVSVDTLFSDHHAVHCQLLVSKPPPVKKTVSYRKIKSIDLDMLSNDIQSSTLCSDTSNNLDGLVKQYDAVLRELLDTHAPLQSRTFVERPLVPWISDKIIEAKKIRRKCEKKWRKSGLTVHKEMYLVEKQRVKALMINAKKEHFKVQFQECAGDQARTFKVAEQILHRKGPPALPKHDSLQSLVNEFSQFFAMKISRIRNLLDATSVSKDSPKIPSAFNGSKFTHFEPTTVEEITKIIKKSSNASCELDPLPTKLLHDSVLDILAPVITSIVNLSLDTGTVPDSLKAALVHPLLKKTLLDWDVLKNYRPVSNLAFVSKVIEKAVALQLFNHMATNDLLETFQSAYKHQHSTETALLRVVNDILRAIDSKEAVFLVLLDLSAAFDTLDHDLLLTLLKETIGIDGNVLKWFTSYLTNRSQQITIDSIKSAIHLLLYGVPQGSVLGPILFCIYILHIGNIVRRHGFQFHIYADDTQVYIGFKPADVTCVLQKLELCIDEIRLWMTGFKLKINDDKTEFMIISSKHIQKSLENHTLHVGSTEVSISKTVRNLGVMMDSVMNMDSQITSVCRSAYFQLRNIGAIRQYLTKDVAAQLIHSFVSSRLDYCNSLLYGISTKSLKRLKKVQNTAARILSLSGKYDHVTPLLKELHWLPMDLRIDFKILLLTYKSVNDLAPSYLCDLLQPYRPARSLRSSSNGLLVVPKSRTSTYGDRAFSIAAPRLWNNLPENIRNAHSVSSFKHHLKTHLFGNF